MYRLGVQHLCIHNVNNGPDFVGWMAINCLRATTGHNEEPLCAKRILTPRLNGSVLEDVILTCIKWLIVMALKHRVNSGSNDYSPFGCVPRYPPGNQKKASIIAPLIMSLSSNEYNELNRFQFEFLLIYLV